LRVLNLTRRNFLRFFLSVLKGELTGQWTSYDPAVVGNEDWYKNSELARQPDADDPSVTVPIDEMMHMLEECRVANELIEQYFADYGKSLHVEYEDLFPTLDGLPAPSELRRVADWLDVPDEFTALQPRYRKQAVQPLSATIENYDAVAEALAGTPFEYCLEDERGYRTPGKAAATRV
jgi:hypothetical protein